MQKSVWRRRFISYGSYPKNRQIILSPWFDQRSETWWNTLWRQVFDYSTECYGEHISFLTFIFQMCSLKVSDRLNLHLDYMLHAHIPSIERSEVHFRTKSPFTLYLCCTLFDYPGHSFICSKKKLCCGCRLPTQDRWAHTNISGISIKGRAVSSHIYRTLRTGITRPKVFYRAINFIFRTRQISQWGALSKAVEEGKIPFKKGT